MSTGRTQSFADDSHTGSPVHDLELFTLGECWERVPKGHGLPIQRYLRKKVAAQKVTPPHKPPLNPFRPRSLASSWFQPEMPVPSFCSLGPSAQAAQSKDEAQPSTSTATCVKPPPPPVKPSCDDLALWEWSVDNEGFQHASRLDNNHKVTVAYCVLREAMLYATFHGPWR